RDKLVTGVQTCALPISPEDRPGHAFTEPPSFWWPQDRAWFVFSEIDLHCTYVGGTAALVERIVADSDLEAFPANLDDLIGGHQEIGRASCRERASGTIA